MQITARALNLCCAEMSDAAAELRAATYRWPGGRGVADIDLEIRSGRWLTLLGPNGAGKSTILRLISGQVAAESGEVLVFGEPPSDAARRRVGVVFQEATTDDLMTVGETLELHARLFGLSRSERAARIGALLEELGIADRAGDRCGTLSGGLRRRLDLARALVHDPKLLLLDEPTLALDPSSAEAIWERLRGLRDGGCAIVVGSNDTAEAEANSDEVVFVDEGAIVGRGAPSELTAALRSDSVELDWPGCGAAEVAALERLEGVGAVRSAPPVLHLTVDGAASFVPVLFQRWGDRIGGIRIRESSLRDAWFQIVGRPLDDGSGS